MQLRLEGRTHKLGRIQRALVRMAFGLRKRTGVEARVGAGEQQYRFRCETRLELNRAAALFVKEPGTVAWLMGHVHPGQVFCDIGANIGAYTVLAARQVGPTGTVYAFEPHAANFARLLENVRLNNLAATIVPSSVALHEEDGVLPFNYAALDVGTANSQLASLRDARAAEFRPELVELKAARSIDSLIASGAMKPPHHVKLDVDGNELLILRGMSRLLGSANQPRTLQVEVNESGRGELARFLEQHGYRLVTKHFTRSGEKRIARGEDPETYAYNAVFVAGEA
jgi:FkbM family methyltransferase